MPTGVYIRVSTEDQATEGFSINAQKEKLTKYAEINDWQILDYYIDDGISGKNIKDRPEITRMLNDIKKRKIKNVLVYKLDRLTRSLLNLMELINLFETYDCSLNSHTEKLDTSNAVGRMFVKILGTFAEFERENLAERVSFGYEQKTKEGNYTNTNGVYGYDYIAGVGELKVNEREALLVNKIYDLYLSNNSMLSISKMLNDEGVPTKRGGKWAQSTIRSILTNPLYIGKVRYGVGSKNKHKAFVVDNVKHLPIVNVKKYDNVQKLMKKRSELKARRYSSNDTYYFHVLKCGCCGGKMHARQQKKNNKQYITYACNGRQSGNCLALGFSHQKMEKAFTDYLKKLQNLLPYDSVFVNEENKTFFKNKQLITRALKKYKLKESETRNLFLEGSLPFDEYKVLMKKIESKLKELENEFKKSEENFKAKEMPVDDAKKIIGNIELNWKHLNNKERKTFLERFVNFIEVKKDIKEVKILNIKFNN